MRIRKSTLKRIIAETVEGLSEMDRMGKRGHVDMSSGAYYLDGATEYTDAMDDEAVARKFGGGPVPMDPSAAALQSLMLLKAAGYRTVTDEDEEEGPMPIDDQIEFLRDVASGNAGY